FKATFENSKKVKTAANKIKKLIQESNLASSYVLKFQQISIRSCPRKGITNYKIIITKAMLERSEKKKP
ncbi:13414_t:CDS:2, partial [Cetraspora pellucida]